MSTQPQPWMKFYPQDWRSDERLRLCSLAARGLWIEMLSLMHRSERYGYLLIGNLAPSDDQIGLLVGALPAEVAELISELSSAGVFSRDRAGTIYSRRMIRDHKKAEIARRNGRFGGNPALRVSYSEADEISASDNPQDKAPDKLTHKLRGQKPEARGQKPESDARVRAREDDIRKVVRAARMSRTPRDARLLDDWLEAGACLDRDVLPAVERIAERLTSKGDQPVSFRLFDADVRASLEKRLEDDRAYERRLRAILGGGA